MSLPNDNLNFEFDAPTPTLSNANIFPTPTDMFTTPSFQAVSSADPQSANVQSMRSQYAKHLRKGMEYSDGDDYMLMFNKTPGDIMGGNTSSATIVNVSLGNGVYTPQFLSTTDGGEIVSERATMGRMTGRVPTLAQSGSSHTTTTINNNDVDQLEIPNISIEEESFSTGNTTNGTSVDSAKSTTSITRDGDLEFAHHQVKDKLTNRTFLTCKRDNFTIVSPTNFTVVSNYIKLVQGFNEPVKQKVPGGKGNTKDCIPRQVVEYNADDMKGLDPSKLSVKCEILGFDRKKNGMIPLDQVTEQPFVQTSDNRWLAIFDNCIVKFSSHLHGQKLALRFTLMDRSTGDSISFVDSKTFQTITQRGKEKQMKRKRKSPETDDQSKSTSSAPPPSKRRKLTWTVQEVRNLLDGYENYEKDWDKILASYDFENKMITDLEAKVEQLFS
mmetsp:Transcript_5369/g.20045  ORF Transcript_5369/g.20045 Transcript_5369/m.20045 type:complete len:442 (-) Transcript_5369:42-1367(-)|eukprot:CAMPEP_0117439900 /NCGR_PEP_ID=MMETSP0759-20121206/2799_1 /TAXON_ID=63605 /ORGANISM="Percolomonas cosmopolitus, Strain WS" /LENGTH=441 /DNA_ID=CAMNT_0005231621 /DNA_START=249 /DNA_END=1574 /DNA_ORIENTATION=-